MKRSRGGSGKEKTAGISVARVSALRQTPAPTMFNFPRTIRAVLAAIAVAAFSAGAVSADSVPETTPSAAVFSVALASETEARARLFSAENALRAGLPSLAEILVADAEIWLKEKNLPKAVNDRFLLVRASAQLARGAFPEAAATLADIVENSSEKRLCEAFVAIGQNRFDELPQKLFGLYPELFASDKRAWFFLARALSENFLGKTAEADADFSAAEKAAITPAVRSRIEFVRAWAQVAAPSGIIPADALERLKNARDAARGTPAFADAAKLYVVALAKSGDRAGAAAALREAFPVPEKDAADFAVLEGLLADDPGSEFARAAFLRAVKARPPRSRQATAFSGLLRNVSALAGSGKKEDAILAGNAIEKFLSELPPDENVSDLELFTRARVAFEIENFRLAEKLSEDLISRFPASPFVRDALRTRVSVALKEKEYRRAVPLLERLRAMNLSDEEKKNTDILVADCNFLSGDYTLAADAYARAEQANSLAGDELGGVFFQQAYSDIRGENVPAAAALLDSALAKRVPAAWTMRTECVVIEALLHAGLLREAAARAEKFLARADLLPDFRLRILWIRALIALDSGDAATALADADSILEKIAAPDGSESAALRESATELESRAVLLKARADFLAGNVDDGLKMLADLREKHPDSLAAADSWLVEGRYFNSAGKPSRALVSYETLIDRYGDREKFADTVAVAAFEASQAAATLGRPEEAVKKMEELVSRHPDSPLVFYAKMRLADFFRILNDFDSALAVYDGLIAGNADDTQMRTVEMRRADTLRAIAARAETDASARTTFTDALRKAEAAYERLFSLPDQPLALKAEAGFKRGFAAAHAVPADVSATNATTETPENRALSIYWQTVNETLAAAKTKGADALGDSGGYWISRCLFAIAEIHEKRGDYDSARNAYEKISAWSADGIVPGGNYAAWRLEKIKEK